MINRYCNVLIVLSVVLIGSCRVYQPKLSSQAKSISVDKGVSSHRTDSIIQIYKATLDVKLSEVLVYNERDLLKGDPESPLGNMFADLLYLPWKDSIQSIFPNTHSFALFNKGGLRTILPAGNVTVGAVFELMPFENELVLIHLKADAVKDLVAGLFAFNGQPVSGMRLSGTPDNYSLYIDDKKYTDGQSVVILTSDYLANGGDRMSFLSKRSQIIPLRIKIRDRLIYVMRKMGASGQKLNFSIDKRMDI